ncbi:MAG: sigma-70 family RNA polymerase sigma factor [Clostridia bacterium]|nr:sigma-70 family RNA polymerase sigma factor [Clostridia bacterium]
MTDAEFERLYQTYFSSVFGYLMRLCNDPSLAEELTSDTFFKALGSVNRFRGDCEILSWLCAIARNAYLSYLRKNGRLMRLHDEEIVEDGAKNLEESYLDKEAVAEAMAALNALNEPYREVFRLRTFGELSYRSIAELFGRTENWACVVYHRARIKIREAMEDRNDEA